jgi:hypothetical protein
MAACTPASSIHSTCQNMLRKACAEEQGRARQADQTPGAGKRHRVAHVGKVHAATQPTYQQSSVIAV